jgi:hypothetical protein
VVIARANGSPLGVVLDIPDTNVLRPAKLLPDNYPPIRGYLPDPAAALRALSGSGRSGFRAAELLGLRHRDEARVGAHKTPLLS